MFQILLPLLIHFLDAAIYQGAPRPHGRQDQWLSGTQSAYGGVEPFRVGNQVGPSFPNPQISPYGTAQGSFINSGYAGTQPNLPVNEFLTDLSRAFLRPLTSLITGPMGPNTQQMGYPPYGSPYGFPNPYGMPMGRPNNMFGINAGLYLGSYGGGNGIYGPNYPYGNGNGILGPNGPYGGVNNRVGGSYGGLSNWPLVPPWIPVVGTLIPPLVLPPPATIYVTIGSSTQPPSTTTSQSTETSVMSSVVSLPIDTMSPEELQLPSEVTNP